MFAGDAALDRQVVEVGAHDRAPAASRPVGRGAAGRAHRPGRAGHGASAGRSVAPAVRSRARRAARTPATAAALVISPASARAHRLGQRHAVHGHRDLLVLGHEALVRRRSRAGSRARIDADRLVARSPARGTGRAARPSARRAGRPPRPARAGRASQRRLARDVEQAGRQLVQPRADRVPVLVHQHDVLVVVQRDDRRPRRDARRPRGRRLEPSLIRTWSRAQRDDPAAEDRLGLRRPVVGRLVTRTSTRRRPPCRGAVDRHAVGVRRPRRCRRVVRDLDRQPLGVVVVQRRADERPEQRVRPGRPRLQLRVRLGARRRTGATSRGSSTNSTSRPSGDVPEITRPAASSRSR